MLDSSRMSAFKLDVGVLLVKRENEPTMKTLEDLLLVCSQKKNEQRNEKKNPVFFSFFIIRKEMMKRRKRMKNIKYDEGSKLILTLKFS